MEQSKNNTLLNILFIILLAGLADMVLNDGRIINGLTNQTAVNPVTYTVTDPGQPLNNMIIAPTAAPVLPPQQVIQVTATPLPAVQNLVTVVPQLQPGFAEATATVYFAATPQPPENVITLDDLAQPTRDYNLTNDQLAACLQAQQTGKRLAPYCPPNPAEYAGQGR